ncbi:hypothetical protein BJX99DRAFT_240868 [Aspergillus californicus]
MHCCLRPESGPASADPPRAAPTPGLSTHFKLQPRCRGFAPLCFIIYPTGSEAMASTTPAPNIAHWPSIVVYLALFLYSGVPSLDRQVGANIYFVVG